MDTANHQYLATWFLSDEEISIIIDRYEVINDTNSDISLINIGDIQDTEVLYTIEEVAGDTYNGYVVTINNPLAIQLIDTNSDDGGQTLTETVEETNAVIAINAAGFTYNIKEGETEEGDILNSFTIADGALLYGNYENSYSMAGFTTEGILVLGDFTYDEAINLGIDDAIAFGPFLVVNGENQVDNEISGGYAPRTAIGQTENGTIILVVIEGRSTSSLGATYYDLQEIMNDYDVINAVNLDGGGSSQLIYEGQTITELSNGNERDLPNAIVVNLE